MDGRELTLYVLSFALWDSVPYTYNNCRRIYDNRTTQFKVVLSIIVIVTLLMLNCFCFFLIIKKN